MAVLRLLPRGAALVFYIHSGKCSLQVRDRRLPVRKGELVVMGSTLYHRFACPRSMMKALALYFQPEFIHGASATTDDAEYLAPFFSQNADFPFVVSARTRNTGRGAEPDPQNSTRASSSSSAYEPVTFLTAAKKSRFR